MKLKDKMKNLYNQNKRLMVTAIILNIVFTVITILSLCGVNIAALSCNNSFLIKMNTWIYEHNLHRAVSGIMLASNIYFMVAIAANDYTIRPLIYTICLLPVCVVLQYVVGVNGFIVTCLLPICLALAYSFKFSSLWKSALFLVIVMVYQYFMMLTKLNIFGSAYLVVDLLTYLLLSIDLYVVFIFYYCICKTIYKNKLKKEDE